MKVVITTDEFDPNKGYLEYYLARELTRMGHKVYIFTFGWSKRLSRTMLREGFEVVNVPYCATIYGYYVPSFSGVAHILEFIQAEKPDIIHCQPLYSPLSLIFISCKHLSKHQIVGSLITGEYSIDSIIANLRYDLVKIVTEHYVANKTATFFAINDSWKSVLLRLFNIPTEKITLTPLGADPSLFRFDAAARVNVRNLLGLSLDDVVVVYSGKIIPSKELDILLKAIAPIMRRIPKVKLLIVGDGDPSYVKCLKQLSSTLQISNNVVFHQWVHRTKLSDFYSASDIAVWPGSVSISIVEAFSAGLPVITKRSLITKFAVEYGNGFTYEPENITDLNGYLEKLITNDSLREDMGKKSRLLVEQKLNWKTITLQYLCAYNSALNKSQAK
jgi:glycosyltransferase involved in cell wall biosynthesis